MASKEDSPKGVVLFSEDVERVQRAHRNDLENIPVFLTIALFYLLTDPSPVLAVNLIRIAAAARLIFTFVYVIFPTQLARFLAFITCVAITVYMSVATAFFFY